MTGKLSFPLSYNFKIVLAMPKAKKKTKHIVVQEQLTAPVRRSDRTSRPSQRVREIEGMFDVPPPPPPPPKSPLHNGMEEDSDDGNSDLTEQLEVAHERIEELQHQLNAALASQTQQTRSLHDTAKKSNQPSTSTGIFHESNRNHFQVIQEVEDDSFQPNIQNNTDTKTNNQKSQSAGNLEQMLSSAITQIINPQVQDKEGKKLASSYLILGSTLDPKVKSKIWAREYIELSSLHQEQMDPAVFVSVQDNGKPSISLKPSKSSPPANFYQWLTWFSTYAAVYLEKFPEQASSMMTYMIRILELSRKHQGFLWRTYDENFRRMRSFVDFPWHITNWEMILQSMHSNFGMSNTFQKSQPFRRNFNKQNANEQNYRSPRTSEQSYRTPRGFCFSFDKQGRCTNHECSKCGMANHFRGNCNNNNLSSQTTSNNQKPEPQQDRKN